MKKLSIALSFILLFALAGPVAFAHPGRTDSSGGHTCRTNCPSWGLYEGQYHYHNGGGSSGGSSGSSSGSSSSGSSSSGSTTTVTPTPEPEPDPGPTEEELYEQWVKDHYQNTLNREPSSEELEQAKSLNNKDEVDELIKNSEEYTRLQESNSTFKVTRIVDGDTIEIEYFGALEKVRLIGIDTPEKGECYFDEASDELSNLILDKSVTLAKDGKSDDVDKYDRLLRYIELDGSDINAKMIELGAAYAYLDYPFDRSEEYTNIEDEAESSEVALWNPETCKVVAEVEDEPQETSSAAPSLDLGNEPLEPYERQYSGWTMFFVYVVMIGGTVALGAMQRKREAKKGIKRSKMGKFGSALFFTIGALALIISLVTTSLGELVTALVFAMLFFYFPVMAKLQNK